MATYSVDTDGGGDYTTLTAAEAALGSALTEPTTITCTGSTIDSSSCTVNVATDSTNSLTIVAATGDEASMSAWDTGRYRRGDRLTISTIYCTVKNLQLRDDSVSSFVPSVYVTVGNATDMPQIEGCRIQAPPNATSEARCVYGANAYARFDNCLINGETGANSVGLRGSNSGTHWTLRNCIITNCASYGVRQYDSIISSLIFDNSTNLYDGGANAQNCGSDTDYSGEGTDNFVMAARSLLFTDAANGDYTYLDYTGTGKIRDVGHLTLSTPTTYAGVARDATPDCGPDEYITSGGITGTGALTLPSITVAGSGVTGHQGTGALTLPAVTADGAGTLGHSGTGALTLPAVTADGAGTTGHQGTGALTLPAVTVDGAGTTGHTGTGALTLPAVMADGAGTTGHTGTGALTLPAAAVSGTGEVTQAGAIVGTGALTLPAASVAGAGSLGHDGTGDISLPAATLDGAGSLGHSGTGDLTLPAATLDGAGSLGHSGTGELTLPAIGVSGSDAEVPVPPAPAGLTPGGIGKRDNAPRRQFANINGKLIQVASYEEAVKLFQHLNKTTQKPKKRQIKLKFAKGEYVTVMDSPTEPMKLSELRALLDAEHRQEDDDLLMLLLTL